MRILEAIAGWLANNSVPLQTLCDLVVAVVAGFTACLACWGLSTWRREFTGKRNIELAEETLALFYQAKEVVSIIRFAVLGPEEGLTRKARSNETEDQKEARTKAYIFIERYGKHQEVFNKLHAIRYRFAARFGAKSTEPFDELRNVVNTILTAAHQLGSLWAENKYHISLDAKKAEDRKNFIQKCERTVQCLDETDKICTQVNDAVASMEKICQPIIARGVAKDKTHQ